VGDHKPKIITRFGCVPETAELKSKKIDGSITSINPISGLNALGGDKITLKGNFVD